MKEALDIRVKGIVQGVGFRPFVYRLAKRYLIDGWVLNDRRGVLIHAEGDEKLLDEFVIEISENAPAAAEVKEIDLKEVPLTGVTGFEIRFSDESTADETTLISPDLATCDECLHEALEDPQDRRFGYPFINCTNCGPRFTIIDHLPYDRANTSMAAFTMCDECSAEYHDPKDRRFHAQPDACFECGPRISFALANQESEQGIHPIFAKDREETFAIIEQAAQMLVEGKILATKDLGGFHLVCDASNTEAVAELRRRKHRDGKPLAVMMRSVEEISDHCAVSASEAKLLRSPQRPIVLLRKLQNEPFYDGIADRLTEVGIMLPCTALQAMLIDRFAALKQTAPVLVMTSGNVHDEPICMNDEEAYEKLAGIADAFLGNDRPILSRFDDSVVRIIATGEEGDAVQFIRRARGYAPAPIQVHTTQRDGAFGNPEEESSETDRQPQGLPKAPSLWAHRCLLATGAEQKNTFTLLRDNEAFVSQHIGDVENADTYDAWLQAKDRYIALFEAPPTALACDLHPEYLTSKWAHEQDLPVTAVQHHHAHIVSVMAEHHLHDAVCGIAFDGTGYGYDGAIWGGEVLLANERTFERFANFAYVPMPGGAACIKHPLRMAYGVLWAFDLLEHPGAAGLIERLGEQADVCSAMIDQGINTPMTSSVGRLFDAASALLGICEEASYEGEPAILLEATAAAAFPTSDGDSAIPEIAVIKNTAVETSTALDTSVVLFDAAPLFEALLDDIVAGVPAAVSARRFHLSFAEAVLTAASLVRELYDIDTVALSGGVFMNRLLIELVLSLLGAAGFTVAINRDLPPNDGCISLGQAVIAWEQANERA